ncbi:restriction endonuclease subunit S [Pseudomonas aeruginosa]|uniref:restriction endonuclease subunit S n=1 Tax=Pseudomonas aeruginosa TaxID=287 RepID=UPI003AFB3DCD
MTRFVLPRLDSTWTVLPLGELAEIKYGSALTSESRVVGGDVPVYGSGGVVGAHDQALHPEQSIVIGRKGSVGSVFLTEGSFWCIDTAYYLDSLNESVDIEYLAAYLKSIDLSRLSISVAIPGLNRKELSIVPVPLPTLPEQQRIVDVLRQADGLRGAKQDAIKLCSELSKALFEKYFGVAGATTQWPMEPFGKYTTYSKYGPRFPDQTYSETGIHILRTTDMNDDGTIRWWEAPKLALTEKQIQEHALRPGTLVVSRSGTIGPFALFDGQEGQCVAGAYLIEFGLSESIESEYVRALFATPYLQAMLRKAVRSVAQPNINAPNIQAIQIPVPPLERQEAFAIQIRALRKWTKQLTSSAERFDDLFQAIIGEAFSGDLTAAWRDKHAAEVIAAASTREALLRELGTKIALSGTAEINLTAKAELTVGPARHWLRGELSDFQRQLLAALTEYCEQSGQSLLVEDPEVFARFCGDVAVTERLHVFGQFLGNRIRRSLSQLAALGLIAKITLPKQNPDTGERDYLKAFRPLRPEEFTGMADVQTFRKALSAGAGQSYYFTVHLDYETSARDGASGLFQVISVEDEDGKDFTHLVDQGRYYASRDDLRNDIASALKVAIDQIELEEV